MQCWISEELMIRVGQRYDHHQKGFEEFFGHGFSTKLSIAGLIYKHFGMDIIAKELQLDEGHPDVLRLYIAVYKSFMEAIDAIDNGINQYDIDLPPRYVNNTHLSARVGRLNLDWMDPDQSTEKENEAFQRAMSLAGKSPTLCKIMVASLVCCYGVHFSKKGR